MNLMQNPQTIIVVVAVLALVIWLYTKGQAAQMGSQWVKFTDLSLINQAVVSTLSQSPTTNMMIDGAPVQTTFKHATINSVQYGVIFSTPAKDIYLTYYEFLNQFSSAFLNSTLFIPARTLENNTIVDSTTTGYAIRLTGITTLNQQTASVIKYTNAQNVEKTISTTVPISAPTGSTFTYTDSSGTQQTIFIPETQWLTFTSLSTDLQTFITSALQTTQPATTLDGTATTLALQSIAINSEQYGVILHTATKDVYLTYYEYLNWSTNHTKNPTLFVPARTLQNNVLVDSTTAGFSISLSGSTMVITSLNQTTPPIIRYTDTQNVQQTISTTTVPVLAPILP